MGPNDLRPPDCTGKRSHFSTRPAPTRPGAAHAETGGPPGDPPARPPVAITSEMPLSENTHAPASRSQKPGQKVVSIYRCVSYRDPFGLCVKDDQECHQLVQELRAQKGTEFQQAADRYDRMDYRVHFVPNDNSTLDPYGYNSDTNPETWTNGVTNTKTHDVYLRNDLSKGDALVDAEHESQHMIGLQHPKDNATIYHADWRAYMELPLNLRRGAVYESDLFYTLWGPNYGTPFVKR